MEQQQPRPGRGRIVPSEPEGRAALVLGGSSSGKSMYAQRLARRIAASAGTGLCYLATMDPCDGEDRSRIAKHRKDREGWGFQTLEIPIYIAGCTEQVRDKVVLLDSITSLLTNSQFSPDGPGSGAEECVMEGLRAVIGTARYTVLVSDDLFSDGIRYDASTEEFRRQLGHVHRRAAELCAAVFRLEYGACTAWKGTGYDAF